MGYTRNCEPLRVWNRLEPRTRQPDFARVLRAEIYDGLWMLARQWQFGEFHGEDTGSAVFARLAMRTRRIDALQVTQGESTPYTDDLPIESGVEQQRAPDSSAMRIQLGRQWLRILDHFGDRFNSDGGAPQYAADAWHALFLERFPIRLPQPGGDTAADLLERARLTGNPQLRQQLQAADGRLIDGLALLNALPNGSIVWSSLPARLQHGIDHAHRGLLVESLQALHTFRQQNWHTPATEEATAWQPSQLEYRFSAQLPDAGDGSHTLNADEYPGGGIEWYSFDLSHRSADRGAPLSDATVSSQLFTVIPSPAEFPGQPQARYWEFEDGAVDLGNLRADSTDLARILVTEFALVYGNNWLVIPCPQQVGSLAEIEGIVVDDVFGQRTLVQPATRNAPGDWTRWEMFSLSLDNGTSGARPATPQLLIPPAAAQVLDGAPQEQVRLLRDEMTNNVWAIEARVPDGLGGSHDGLDHARRLTAALQSLVPPVPADDALPGVDLRYHLGNRVPENWIPFLPVHKPGQDREIRLQRASMPRFFQQTIRPIRPLTNILRPGLLANDQQADPYFIHEEEVPRSGIRIDGGYRRSRGFHGSTFVWYARRKRSGRGEGNSGLRFDTLEAIKPQKS